MNKTKESRIEAKQDAANIYSSENRQFVSKQPTANGISLIKVSCGFLTNLESLRLI